MPSTRSRTFLDPDVLEAELVPTGETTRDMPPASVELRAPSDVAERSDARRRRERGAKVGRPLNAEMAAAVSTVFETMKKEIHIEAVADAAGIGPVRAKDIMKTAKARMQEAVSEYVDIHLVGAKVAALKGDTRPAEWALENIAVEGERVVDPPSKTPQVAAPTFNLGFVIGGIPQRPQLTSGSQTPDK